MQRRLEPLNLRLLGGCHLTRKITDYVERAGFVVDPLDNYYAKGAPKPFGYTFEGRAALKRSRSPSRGSRTPLRPMSDGTYLTAEARARVEIDGQLVECGWAVQDRKAMNLYAGQGVAVREFIMAAGHGRADYLLFIDQKAVGAIEAKAVGNAARRCGAAVGQVRGGPAQGPALAREPAAVPVRVDRRRDHVHRRVRSRPAFAAGRHVSPSRVPCALDAAVGRRRRRWLLASSAGAARCRSCRRAAPDPGGGDQSRRSLDGPQPSAGVGPDGDGVGQDVHGRQPRLPAGSLRRRGAGAVPRRPGEPRPPDAARVPAVRDAGRRPQVHRSLQRAAAHLEPHRPGGAW